MSLRLDWVGHDAVKFACEKWHYSKCCPLMKLNAVGVWENAQYIGCIIFSPGATASIGKPYKLTNGEICELTRVALNEHSAPVTKMVSIAIKMIKRQNPGLKLIVSYADPYQGHMGGIYQGGNWVYVGESAPAKVYFDKVGKQYHSRNVGPIAKRDKFGVTIHAKSEMVRTEMRQPKHKYLYPLTDDMRSKIEPLRKPYPKRASVVHTVEQPAYQQGEGGSIPTLTHIRTGKEPVRVE